MESLSKMITSLLSPQNSPNSITVPNHPIQAPSTVTFTSDAGTPLSAPKVHPINESTWDWWYFDAVQIPHPANPANRHSVVVTFYTAVSSGFEMVDVYTEQGFSSLTLGEVSVTYPNATHQTYLFNATQARIEAGNQGEGDGDGVSGVWSEGAEAVGFEGSSDMGFWRVEMNSSNIFGEMVLQSVRIPPPHSEVIW